MLLHAGAGEAEVVRVTAVEPVVMAVQQPEQVRHLLLVGAVHFAQSKARRSTRPACNLALDTAAAHCHAASPNAGIVHQHGQRTRRSCSAGLPKSVLKTVTKFHRTSSLFLGGRRTVCICTPTKIRVKHHCHAAYADWLIC